MSSQGSIVVWVDAGEGCADAVAFATAEAQLRNTGAVAVSAIPRSSLVLMDAIQFNSDQILTALRGEVETWTAPIRAAGVACEIIVSRGDEAETVCSVAAEHKAVLAVVSAGTHVSSRIAHHWAKKLPCPTVMVPAS